MYTNKEWYEFCAKHRHKIKPFIGKFFCQGYLCVGQMCYGKGDTPKQAYEQWKEAVDAHTS